MHMVDNKWNGNSMKLENWHNYFNLEDCCMAIVRHYIELIGVYVDNNFTYNHPLCTDISSIDSFIHYIRTYDNVKFKACQQLFFFTIQSYKDQIQ